MSKIDQQKLKQLIDKIAQMQQIATRIYDKEKNREWLTPKDYQDIKLYDDLMNEEIAIGKELFGEIKGVSAYK